MAATELYRITNGRRHLCGGQIFDAQLDGLDPCPSRRRSHFDRIHHRIETEVVFGRREGPSGRRALLVSIQSEAAIEL